MVEPYKEENLNFKKQQSTEENKKLIYFLRKYFFEGQRLREGPVKREESDDQQNFAQKHRKLFGIIIPFVFFQSFYWLLAYRYGFLHLFKTKYIMSLVMIFGALVGGMTTEGGGAIAFPVMTIALNITPTVARDFSLMVQSCGMTSSAFTILFMRIVVEWNSIIYSSLGAIFGIIFGLEVIDVRLSPPEKKMIFVSTFFSFALALFILNSERKRTTFDRIQNFCKYKAIILFVNGFVGGIFTAIAGSGIDVYSFSILTLLFRISEKIATPTSVVLISVNSLFGFFWRHFMQNDIQQESWDYLAVCVPIVVLIAPLGSFLASHFHRLVLAILIYILEAVALVGAIIIIRPSIRILILSLLIIISSFSFYYTIAYIGRKYLDRINRQEESLENKNSK